MPKPFIYKTKLGGFCLPKTGLEVTEISAALNRVQKRKKRKKNVLAIAVVIAVVVIAAISVPFLAPLIPSGPLPTANTCLNLVQDSGEEGVDCGGPCAAECPRPGPRPPVYVDPALVLPTTTISDIAFLNGNFYLLDELRHRIMMYDSEFEHVKNFGETVEDRPDGGWNYYSGGVGNDKLLFPASIYAANNKLYLLDRVPRIQVFSKDLVYEKTLRFSSEAIQALPKLPDTPNADGGMASIAVASNGNIFVADEVSNAVALFDPQLNLIKAVGPEDPNGPELPRQISLGSDGKLYVADSLGGRVQVYSSDLELENSIDNALSMPFAVAVDRADTMYVMDGGDSKLKVFGPRPTDAKEAGGLGSGQLQFYNAKVVKFSPGGEIYIVEEGNARIQVLDTGLNFVKFIESIGRTVDVALTPFYPAIAPNGDIAFSDPVNSKVFIVDKDYALKKVLGGRGFGNEQFNTPKGLAFDKDGSLYVSDPGNRRIQVFSPSYMYVKTLTHEQLIWPLAISVSEQNQIFVVDDKHKKVLILGQQGTLIDEIGEAEGITLPLGILAEGGKIYITDDLEKTIEIFDSSLEHLKTVGDIDTKVGQHVEFNESLAIDSKNRLLFCDNRNRSVVAFDLGTEQFSTFGSFGSSLQELSILEVATSQEVIAVTDMEEHRVKVFDHEGNQLKEILWGDVV
jgi:DNA-binding beta-propeller fold protein YncE